MFNWLREFYTVRAEFLEHRRFCKSCETLQLALDRATREKEQLLQKILFDISRPEPKQEPPPVTVPLQQRRVPFSIKQQLLEAEDREKARVLAEFGKRQEEARTGIRTPISPPDSSINELEQRLGLSGEESTLDLLHRSQS